MIDWLAAVKHRSLQKQIFLSADLPEGSDLRGRSLIVSCVNCTIHAAWFVLRRFECRCVSFDTGSRKRTLWRIMEHRVEMTGKRKAESFVMWVAASVGRDTPRSRRALVEGLLRSREKDTNLDDWLTKFGNYFCMPIAFKSLQSLFKSLSFTKCTSPGRSRLFGERTEEGVVSEEATLDRFVRENRDFWTTASLLNNQKATTGQIPTKVRLCHAKTPSYKYLFVRLKMTIQILNKIWALSLTVCEGMRVCVCVNYIELGHGACLVFHCCVNIWIDAYNSESFRIVN